MALGPTGHRGGREATDSAPYTYLCTPPPPTIFFSSLPRMRDLRCSRIALCIAARGSVAVAGMMPAQEEADGSFHECSRESRGRARPRERGNHRRCGLSTAADRSRAPGGGRLRWPAPGERKVIRIGPGLGTAPEVEAGTISASALSHRSRAVPVLGVHGSRAPRRPARRRIGCGTWRTNGVTRASLFATAVSSSAPGRASAPRFVQPRPPSRRTR